MEKGYSPKKFRRKIPKVGRSYERHMKENKTFDKSKDINDLVEELYLEKADKVIMDKKEFKEEHEKLVDVLESPSRKDDKKEAKKQKKEMNQQFKKSIDDIIDEVLEKGGPGSGRKKGNSKYAMSDKEFEAKTGHKPGEYNEKWTPADEGESAARIENQKRRIENFKNNSKKVKKSKEQDMSIETEIEELAEQMEKSTTNPVDEIKETIKQLGPEGLKKAMATLNAEQQTILKSVLEGMTKAVTMDDAYAAPRVRENIKDTNYDVDKADDDADEKLVKPEAAQHKNQGGSGVEGEAPWEGQIIKSELIKLKDEIIKSYEDAGLDYTVELVKAMMKKKMAYKAKKDDDKDESKAGKQIIEAVDKIAEGEADERVEEHNKKMHKKDMKKSEESSNGKLPEQDQLSDTDNNAKGSSRVKKENKDELEIGEDNKEAQKKVDDMKQGAMKKSIIWESPNARLRAYTSGRNHHFNVNKYYDEVLGKSKETASEDMLQKSKAKKEDLNDIIEKGLDVDSDTYLCNQKLNEHKVNGHAEQSFSDVDLIKIIGLSEDDAKKILNEEVFKGGPGSGRKGHTTDKESPLGTSKYMEEEYGYTAGRTEAIDILVEAGFDEKDLDKLDDQELLDQLDQFFESES